VGAKKYLLQGRELLDLLALALISSEFLLVRDHF